ncbi:MAG: hypothetical protein R3D45_03425 [Rhizobiaceae bacterium]
MSKCRLLLFRCLAAPLVLAALPAVAQAGEMRFRFTSHAPSPVLVRLFSGDRLQSWPDDGGLFILADRSPRKFSVSCKTGERICYGAWIEGDITRFWGAGDEGRHDCDDCCHICEPAGKSPRHQVIFD